MTNEYLALPTLGQVDEVDRFSETPPWRQIADELVRQIETGEIEAGRPIPSKAQLKGLYGVAGNTADKAVQYLKDRGLVRASPGMGMYTLPESERPKRSG